MKRLLPLILVLCVTAAIAPVASARGPLPIVPKIHSTAGTGPGGCVYFTKFVGMSFNRGEYLPSEAKLLLDGRKVMSRKWTFAIVGRRAHAAAALKSSFGLSWVVNLKGLRPGRHTLRFTVSGTPLLPTYRSRAAVYSSQEFSTTARITKCG